MISDKFECCSVTTNSISSVHSYTNIVGFGRYHLGPDELFDAHQARLDAVLDVPPGVGVVALLAVLSVAGIALDLRHQFRPGSLKEGVVETVGPGAAGQPDKAPAVELSDKTPVLGLLELSVEDFLAKEIRIDHHEGLSVRKPFKCGVVRETFRHHGVPELCREGPGFLLLAGAAVDHGVALGLAYYRWGGEFGVDVGIGGARGTEKGVGPVKTLVVGAGWLHRLVAEVLWKRFRRLERQTKLLLKLLRHTRHHAR